LTGGVHLAPRLSAEFQEATLAGDYARALTYQDRLMPLHRAAFAEPNPVPTKYALSLLGRCTDEVRSPMVPLEETSKARMQDAMRHAGLLN
jgi:4-hydroxy-tetrahydrodipicolinate synthase